MSAPVIVWFQRDLRRADHPALTAACRSGGPVIPVFLWTPEAEGCWRPGGASRWWLHHSLAMLQADLRERGSDLIFRAAPESGAALLDLAAEAGATSVYWNRVPEPASRKRESAISSLLHKAGVAAHAYEAALLFPPGELLNQQGRPFQVFTPFWRQAMNRFTPEEPLPAPRTIPAPERFPASSDLHVLGLLPDVDWADNVRKTWQPGERGAARQLRRFRETGLAGYRELRDRPDREGVSRISPHLHFGEITVRQIWRALEDERPRDAVQCFRRQLGWREFGHHLLHHFPHTPGQPLREEFRHFPWARRKAALRRWQKGQTGYPIVDAGMRQLWRTGWMHNRIRMVAASFLVKGLLLPWQDGAAWFWDTLVDADLANNTLGWQWTAGCGADAAPYFRVFNPILQGMKYDPRGDYVRRYVPELNELPAEWIHRPWEAPVDVLKRAGVVLGQNYPRPMVDHGVARDRALQAYSAMKDGLG